MRHVLCLCAQIPRVEIRHHLVVVSHVAEIFTTTGTARWIARTVPSARWEIYGAPADRDRKSRPEIPPAARLLFPSASAEVLTAELAASHPLTLVIPDGTWRQASKMIQRDRRLSRLSCVRLPPGPPSLYRLRTQPCADGVSTFEAAARALGILEGPQVEARLLDIFRKMVDRTLWSRGQLPADRCWGGIPEAAFEADRQAGHRGRERQAQRRGPRAVVE
jgi:DTW domain-containing protein YfiP